MKLFDKIKERVNAYLGDTHDHYSCFLPKKPGYITGFLLRRIFSGIKINPDLEATISTLPENAVVVYTAKYKSYFEYLCYYTLYMQHKLPYPQAGFDCSVYIWQPLSRVFKIILAHTLYFFKHFEFPDPYKHGFFGKEIQKGRTCFLPLIEKKDFYRRFLKSKTDPVRRLINIQKQTGRPIYIIPQLMFFSKNPESFYPTLTDVLFGTRQKPGKLRRFATLFTKPEKIFIEISDPIDLLRFMDGKEHIGKGVDQLSVELRRDLLHQLNSHRRSITGPTIKTPEEIKQNILTGDSLREFMEGYSKRRNLSIWQARKEALGYIDEIAAKYSPPFISIAHKIAGRFVGMMFEAVAYNREGLAKIKSMSRKGPVILMPCHKSHIDYIILSYILYANNLPCPHIFAGKNLAFWPMGTLFRKVGAFFVRRTFKGAMFYSKVFSAYVNTLLKEGFNIEVFIEGTRSRSGKLMNPQLGMMSILLNAFKNGSCRDMIIAPVSIMYDRTPDEDAYFHEINGGKKEPESFLQMFRAKRFLKSRYGRIHIHFEDPFSMNDLLDQKGTDIESIPPRKLSLMGRDIAARVMHSIDKNTIVTPQSLVAGALLTGFKEVVPENEVMFRIDACMAQLHLQKAKITDTLAEDYHVIAKRILSHYVERKFISPVNRNGKDVEKDVEYRIIPGKRTALEYYKNNSISFFMPACFTAISILEKDAFQFSSTDLHNTYQVLNDLFAFEFTREPERPPAYIVRKTVKAFIDDAILVPHQTLPDTYNLSSEGYRKLKFFAGYAAPFFESYKTALHYFSKYAKNRHDKDKRVKKMRSFGIKMHKKGDIFLKESISTINYVNASDFFVKNGVRGQDDKEKIQSYNAMLSTYMTLLSR